jgi:hypothetical protein
MVSSLYCLTNKLASSVLRVLPIVLPKRLECFESSIHINGFPESRKKKNYSTKTFSITTLFSATVLTTSFSIGEREKIVARLKQV